MIDKAAALPTLLARLRKMETGRGLALLTYKRDRSVTVIRLDVNRYEVRENGFAKTTKETDQVGLKGLLRTLLKREFPRSNKIRVRELSAADEC
ncbi:hypothetical protein [Pseudodesulfovibrio sp.]|uniref:hypothetical protein n=1 Tax=Pseudodesulfovibrio sp. TaxID=2035812 RepID=UPI0026275CA4|nr:hypothetical protein [Pseudodesulfovibrio sp.]MDD3312600.1 hypothetical protein [Pseudodesulfovibrio sp.]